MAMRGGWQLLVAGVLLLAGCVRLPGVYEPSKASPAAETTRPGAPVASQAPAVAAVGSVAPDAAFFDKDGARHTLSEYKGRFLALVFFAHW
jgi:hypothetical protein